jgi:hypothetical protein
MRYSADSGGAGAPARMAGAAGDAFLRVFELRIALMPRSEQRLYQPGLDRISTRSGGTS